MHKTVDLGICQVQMNALSGFPKPQVACSTHAGGANEPNFNRLFGGEFNQNSRDNRFFDTRSLVISATFDIR